MIFLRQLVLLLNQSGLLRPEAAFIDGTKIELKCEQVQLRMEESDIQECSKVAPRVYEELPSKLKVPKSFPAGL